MSHQQIRPPTKKSKSVGAYITLNIKIYISFQIFQIENLTTFFTLGVIGPKYTQYFENAFAGFCSITIVAQIFGNF